MKEVIHVPADTLNPYSRLLSSALESRHIDSQLWFSPPSGRNPRALLSRLRRVDLVHWHWLERFYQGRNVFRFLIRGALFTSVLVELRLRGVRQVVTVHNLLPHKHRLIAMHKIMFRIIGVVVDRIIVHHSAAVAPVVELYGNHAKVRIVPHVDYGEPDASGSREDYRRNWNLEAFPRWAIMFGGVSRYKRFELVTQLARPLAERGIGLVIAGRCKDGEYKQVLLRDALDTSPKFFDRRLDEDELSELLLACDAAILPYSGELTSGAAHLAISHGLPIVGTKAPAFRDLVRRGIALCVDPENKDALKSSIEQAVYMANDDWSKLTRDYRVECGLDIVGLRTAEVYAELYPELYESKGLDDT